MNETIFAFVHKPFLWDNAGLRSQAVYLIRSDQCQAA
jgi:hypothetical protein